MRQLKLFSDQSAPSNFSVPRIWAYGAGVDSTAGLILDTLAGREVTLITLADVGAEKKATYDFIPIFDQWLRDHGQPGITIVNADPAKPETRERYRVAAQQATDACGITLDEEELARLSRLYGNMVANETLPSAVYNSKACSVRWKLAAQEPPRTTHPALMECWANGLKPVKCIGFDATEDHRVRATYATGDRGSMPKVAGVPDFGERYEVIYPLRDAGLDRAGCERLIADQGLPVPPKSACFFCPAMTQIELLQLQKTDPDLWRLAKHMEETYQLGKHFRGYNRWTWKAQHKATGRRFDAEEGETVPGETAAEARGLLRAMLKDEKRGRSGYAWELKVSPTVVGLGRSKAWKDEELYAGAV